MKVKIFKIIKIVLLVIIAVWTLGIAQCDFSFIYSTDVNASPSASFFYKILVVITGVIMYGLYVIGYKRIIYSIISLLISSVGCFSLVGTAMVYAMLVALGGNIIPIEFDIQIMCLSAIALPITGFVYIIVCAVEKYMCDKKR